MDIKLTAVNIKEISSLALILWVICRPAQASQEGNYSNNDNNNMTTTDTYHTSMGNVNISRIGNYTLYGVGLLTFTVLVFCCISSRMILQRRQNVQRRMRQSVINVKPTEMPIRPPSYISAEPPPYTEQEHTEAVNVNKINQRQKHQVIMEELCIGNLCPRPLTHRQQRLVNSFIVRPGIYSFQQTCQPQTLCCSCHQPNTRILTTAVACSQSDYFSDGINSTPVHSFASSSSRSSSTSTESLESDSSGQEYMPTDSSGESTPQEEMPTGITESNTLPGSSTFSLNSTVTPAGRHCIINLDAMIPSTSQSSSEPISSNTSLNNTSSDRIRFQCSDNNLTHNLENTGPITDTEYRMVSEPGLNPEFALEAGLPPSYSSSQLC